ncbi:polysaccharide biosynthesis tyrosine autokinase [Microbacterium sp. YJN-G]|uniref:polysaccharide biosynthesis tyrosine autokinase n=1 Tax=Microbacterium sp. YJN-G TaxID=2763257 RepID=UPI001877CCB1|nr:polysaccharide biosynthesis tyrosine autokinase [Microbacterium sp. YJN-G]
MESNNLMRVIRYHWVAILICAQLGILFGAALAIVTPREYTAHADVFVQVTGGSSTSDVAAATNYSQQQARNFSAVATREIVLQEVIDELELDVTVPQLRKQVSTVVPLNSTMITISGTDSSPNTAADIANSVAAELTAVVPRLTPEVTGKSTVRMQIIESANPPATASSPNVPLLLVLGLLAGVVAAAVVVAIRAAVGTRVHSASQAAAITGAALIGTIALDRKAGRQPVPVADGVWSRRAEEYRQLRTNLRYLQPDTDHKVFVVTSSVPGEGKSTTSANMAAALAASGLRVGLVEADLRRPTLADLLDMTEGPGLAGVLTDQVSLEDAFQSWGPDGMQVLLAGDMPPNPSELIESARGAEIFAAIRQRFDVTIIDSPPLAAVADAAALTRQLGGAVLVVGSRRVRARELRRAVNRLNTIGVAVEGIVVNFVSVPRADRFDYGYVPSPKAGPARTSASSAAPRASRARARQPLTEHSVRPLSANENPA